MEEKSSYSENEEIKNSEIKPKLINEQKKEEENLDLILKQNQGKLTNKNMQNNKAKEKEAFQKYEWFGYLKRCRNDAIVILSIICLQLPFELAYAHLYVGLKSDIVR